jgi:hypothetical protein
MTMSVPILGGLFDRLLDLLPRLEPAALHGEGPEHLQPRLDQVQIGPIPGLEDELPPLVVQREQQYVRSGGELATPSDTSSVSGL